MRLIALAPMFVLLACSPTQQDDLARDAARQAIRPVLQEQLPGVPLEPATDCIIDNATSREILALAADAVIGPTASTVEIVGNVIARPETIQCLATEGLPVLLNRL